MDMSLDHKPEDTEEIDRIHKAGGRVTMDGRVNGGLNLSRAIGDHAYKTVSALDSSQSILIVAASSSRIFFSFWSRTKI